MEWRRGRSRHRRGSWSAATGKDTGTAPPSRQRRFALVAATVAFVFAVTTLMADALVRPSLHAWATTKAVTVATSVIARAAQEHLLPDVDASELFEAVTDSEGDLVLIDYNMHKLNELRARAAAEIQIALAEELQEDLLMPVGLLTGVDFLAGFGPRVPVRIVPVGAFTTLPRSDFTASGINMINHRLYVYIKVVIKVIAPYVNVEVPVEQDIVLTNQIIPGKVPKVFVGIEGMDLGSLLDGQFAVPGTQ